MATAKGLIAGPIKMYNRDSSVLDCNVAGGEKFIICNINYFLIITLLITDSKKVKVFH